MLYKYSTPQKRMANLIEKCKAYYELHSAGGCLHIVLDDGNVMPEHIGYCLEEAIKEKDWDAVEIVAGLLNLKTNEKKYLVRYHYSKYAVIKNKLL